MKVSKLTIAMIVLILIMSYFGGQFIGYLNRRVAEGLTLEEFQCQPIYYVQEWIEDTNGRWVW